MLHHHQVETGFPSERFAVALVAALFGFALVALAMLPLLIGMPG